MFIYYYMHRVLERQLKKVFGSLEAVPQDPHMSELIALIDATYVHNDEDRELIERSLDISSQELGGLNKRLREESDSMKKTLDELGRMNKLMINRELKMIELKKEIMRLNNHEASSLLSRSSPAHP